jgi:hypothetical protein
MRLYNGAIKYGNFAVKKRYDTAQCSNHIIAISANIKERRVSIYEESKSGSLRVVVFSCIVLVLTLLTGYM